MILFHREERVGLLCLAIIVRLVGLLARLVLDNGGEGADLIGAVFFCKAITSCFNSSSIECR